MLAAKAGRPDPDGAFRGLRGGMGQLPAAIARALPSASIRTREPVSWLTRGAPWRVVGASGGEIAARTVVLAVPAQAAARLVAPFDGVLAATCAELRTLSSATITYGLRARPRHGGLDRHGDYRAARRGDGARGVVGHLEMGRTRAGDCVVLRAFAGGAFDLEALDADDDALVARAHADLAPLLGLSAPPVLSRVYRWTGHKRQPEVDVWPGSAHRGSLEGHPGVFLTGSAYRGVGMPDVLPTRA